MKSLVYVLIAVFLYAIQNVVIDVKLKQFSTVSLLMGFYLTMLPLAVGLFLYQKFTGQEMIIPTGEPLKIVAFVAVMFFIADFFYVGAYTSGGNVVAVTIVTVLMPVFGALMKFLWVKETPTTFHFVGFVFAMLAIVFIAVGDSKKPVAIKAEAATTQASVP